jgi:primase-polymerase (primpol)-like protein
VRVRLHGEEIDIHGHHVHSHPVVDLGESYTEVSPSGKGLRQFCLGKLNAALTHKAAQVEVYSAGRYLTVTGDWIAGTSDEIREVPKTLKLLRARVDSFKAALPG